MDGGPPAERAAEALNAVLLPTTSPCSPPRKSQPIFHARFSAVSRTYRYRVLARRTPSPLEARRALWWPRPVDLDALSAAAALLPGEHDFTAFTPTETQHEVFVRDVLSATWERDGDRLDFTITADSFLRHMVRTLVGTMLEAGPEAAERLAALLEGRPRRGSRSHRSAVGPVPGARRLRKRVTVPFGDSHPALARIAGMRFPVVLFDLDGTLIDSGPIILASMQHATRTVLGREIAYEELAATVGGQGLVSQMRALDPDRVDELVEVVQRAQRPAARDARGVRRTARGAPAASCRRTEARDRHREAPPHRPARARALPRARGAVRGRRRASRTPNATSRIPSRCSSRSAKLGAEPSQAAYVGDSPFDIRAAKAAGVFAVAVGWGGIHPDDRLLEEEPDAFVRSRPGAPRCPLGRRRRPSGRPSSGG